MKVWVILPGLIGVLAVALGCALLRRWGFHWSGWGGIDEWKGLAALAWMLASAVLLPALLLYCLMLVVFKKLKGPSWRTLFVLVVMFAGIGFFGGARPLWRKDRLLHLQKLEWETQSRLPAELGALRKLERFPEMVKMMEEALVIHERLVDLEGLKPRHFNHGFSYLFVTLHPASDDLPPRLGTGLTEFLYDAWHDGVSQQIRREDELTVALTTSVHPLLRSIGYWVGGDYVAFEREAMAAVGDPRMDPMVLVAACAFGSERADTLESIEPVLERGVGLGWQYGGAYRNPPWMIRSYIEGKAPKSTLRAYYVHPR